MAIDIKAALSKSGNAAKFSTLFIEGYMSPAFGARLKAEIDLLVFTCLIEAKAVDPDAPIYDIARALNIPPARVRNLILNWQLRSTPPTGDLRDRIVAALKKTRFVVDLGDLGFVVMDSGQIAKESAGDNNGDDDDDDDDGDVADTGNPDDTVVKLRRDYAAISGRVPSPAWLLTHVPFNAVKLDKNSGDDQIVNTVQQQAIGGLLPGDVEMIVSGHVHTFEALSFADANPPRPPQLVVGTGGVKLAKRPKKPDDIGGAPVSNAFILKDFAYIVWDREGTNWRGALFGEDGTQIARCKLADRKLTCNE